MNHDANQWSELWKATSECSLKTEKFLLSFTHILRFSRFLNGNWHKITVWQIQKANSNNRVSSSKFIMTFSCCQRTVLLKKKVFSRFILLLLLLSLRYFRELYCNSTMIVYNLKIFLQFKNISTIQIIGRIV